MWTLQFRGSAKKLTIPPDDVVFTAILVRGPTRHTKFASTATAFHLPEASGCQLEFSMTVLEASAIDAKYPDFGDDGLMGRWKLIAPKATSGPSVCLLKAFEDPKLFLTEALSTENPDWVRTLYEQAKKFESL
jgi:hypothetical protein